MSIVTKTGDQGETGLIGNERISKDSNIICAIGTIDELNSAIGLIVARKDIDFEIIQDLKKIQKHCFTIGAELAISTNTTEQTKNYIPHISDNDVQFLDKKISKMENKLPKQTKFILPGGTPEAAMCFWVRTIVRRVERKIIKIGHNQSFDKIIIKYVNRLSDYFYILARFLNQEHSVSEVEWNSR